MLHSINASLTDEELTDRIDAAKNMAILTGMDNIEAAHSELIRKDGNVEVNRYMNNKYDTLYYIISVNGKPVEVHSRYNERDMSNSFVALSIKER